MKKIINWKLYDTETADFIGGYTKNGTSIQDFNYVEKGIYRTKNGQLFEYVIGGASTEYACRESRNWYPWTHITLMESADVIRWMEENSFWLPLTTTNAILSVLTVQEG